MKKTLLMAHRGFSGRFPENTRRAFMEAIALGQCAEGDSRCLSGYFT